MTIDQINELLAEFSTSLGLPKSLALDEAGILQLDYDEGDETLELDLELDQESGNLIALAPLPQIEKAAFRTLLIENALTLSPRCISAGLSGDDLDTGVLIRTFEEGPQPRWRRD